MRYTTTIPVVPPSFNEWKGWHWAKQERERKAFQEQLWASLCEKGNRCPRGLAHVDLRAVLYFPVARERDSDNRAALLWKWVKDSLVHAHVIPNDTPEFCSYHEPVLARGRQESTFLILEWEEPACRAT